MDISRSLEALYLDGTGMSELPTTSKVSISGYDGFSDMLSLECSRSEENLTFLDTFQMIEAKNAADKVKMCRKLAANYGTRSRIDETAATSIESFCNMMSLEGAEQAEAAGTDTGNEKAQTPATNEKKRGFFKTIFGAIAKFFKGIAKMFKHMARTIAGWFSRKEADGGPVNEVVTGASATEPTNNNANYKNIRTGGFDPKKGQKNTDKLKNIDLRTVKSTKIKAIYQEYNRLAESVKRYVADTNTSDEHKFISGLGVLRSGVDKVIEKFGIKGVSKTLSNWNSSGRGNTIAGFEKYYKHAEKAISQSFKANEGYESIMNAVYDVRFIDQKTWLNSVEKQVITKNEINSLSKVAADFSKAADVYAEVSNSLVAMVDKTLSGRITTINTNGNNTTVFGKDTSGKTNATESNLRVMAALLRFASRIGKTVMDGYTRIINTANEAKKYKKK